MNYTDPEIELKELLEEYGMEEIIDEDPCTTWIWYKGSDIKKEGLQIWAADGRSQLVRDAIEALLDHPEWKYRKPQ